MTYVPETSISNGVVLYKNANDFCIALTKEMLGHPGTLKRAGKNWKTLHHYHVAIDSTKHNMVSLPLHRTHETYAFMLREVSDYIEGRKGSPYGLALFFDRYRVRKRFNEAAMIQWQAATALGRVGQNQIGKAIQSLRGTADSRNVICSIWDEERDLIAYTNKKHSDTPNIDYNKREYLSIPCTTSLQFSLSSEERHQGRHKEMQTNVVSRSMDYDVMIHNVHGYSELGHYVATSSYPGGYGGRIDFTIGSLSMESYGASEFVRFGRCLDIWGQEQDALNIDDLFPNVRQIQDSPCPEAPKQKAYYWFEEQWLRKEDTVWAAFNNQWDLVEERLQKIEYQHYKDWAIAEITYLFLLALDKREHFVKYFWDSKKVQWNLQKLEEMEKEWTPLQWSQQQIGRLQYFTAVDHATWLCQRGKYDQLNQLLNASPQLTRLSRFIVAEAIDFCGKKETDHALLRSSYPEAASLVDFIYPDDVDTTQFRMNKIEAPQPEIVEEKIYTPPVPVEKAQPVLAGGFQPDLLLGERDVKTNNEITTVPSYTAPTPIVQPTPQESLKEMQIEPPRQQEIVEPSGDTNLIFNRRADESIVVKRNNKNYLKLKALRTGNVRVEIYQIAGALYQDIIQNVEINEDKRYIVELPLETVETALLTRLQ